MLYLTGPGYENSQDFQKIWPVPTHDAAVPTNSNIFDRRAVIGEGRQRRVIYHQCIGSVSYSNNNKNQQHSLRTEIENNAFKSRHSLLQWESLAQVVRHPHFMYPAGIL